MVRAYSLMFYLVVEMTGEPVVEVTALDVTRCKQLEMSTIVLTT